MNSTDYMGRLLGCHLHKKSTRQTKIDPSLVYIQLGPSGVANSIIGGGAHIHIFEFTGHENN